MHRTVLQPLVPDRRRRAEAPNDRRVAGRNGRTPLGGRCIDAVSLLGNRP
ncbi:hypothetical protein HQO90_02295 [Rhodococcus fascians]|nr:hypothetical protein [Rhodococcus fascians]